MVVFNQTLSHWEVKEIKVAIHLVYIYTILCSLCSTKVNLRFFEFLHWHLFTCLAFVYLSTET